MTAPVDVLAVPLVVQTAPKHIWLQIADDAYSATEAFPEDALDQITWCADSMVDTEVKYVRADLVAELIEACKQASATLGHIYHTTPLPHPLEQEAHDGYQRLDAAIASMGAAK